MGRPKRPQAVAEAKGRVHDSRDLKDERRQREVYASSNGVSPPASLTDHHMVEMFKRYAAYMERVNELAGEPVYGDTDAETLADMVQCHFRFLDYRKSEGKARDVVNKQRYNSMKHKEAQTFERLMKLLRLDPASRVDMGPRKATDGDDGVQW